MLRRATPCSLWVGADTARITFVVKDTLAYGGWLWLCDSLGNSIAYTDEFRNNALETNSAIINDGAGLYNDSSLNTVTISSANCVFGQGHSFSNVRKARIVLTDGRQYAGTYNTYDCRSISAMVSSQ
jgi:hypothetical protein